MIQRQESFRRHFKLALLLLVLVATVTVFIVFRDSFSRQALARHESTLIEWRDRRPLLVYGSVFLIYATVTGLSLPGAAAMSLVVGWYFGFWRGVLLISFASTTGATIAFLMSRYFFRDAVQRRFGKRLETFNEALEREGAFYLFTLRLIPAVPFFVLNLVMGLTPIRVRTYWWVSQVGMLPGTCVYIFTGSRFDLQQIAKLDPGAILRWDVLLAFALLGLFPLVVKKLVQRFRPGAAAAVEQQPEIAADPPPTESKP